MPGEELTEVVFVALSLCFGDKKGEILALFFVSLIFVFKFCWNLRVDRLIDRSKDLPCLVGFGYRFQLKEGFLTI